MSRRSRLRARVRNALFRAVHRVPRGAISPLVANDLFHAHESLFAFLGAFVSQRRVLFVGNEAYGAHAVRQGAAGLTAVMTSAPALGYGRRTYAGPGLEFHDAIPAGASYDVVIHMGALPRDLQQDLQRLTAAVQRNGKLLISVTPAEDAATSLRDGLSSRFANVRRFVHLAGAALDFSSPDFSVVPPDAFSFEEIAASAPVPGNALGLVYMATDEPKWRDLQLHLGCGPIGGGWINIDTSRTRASTSAGYGARDSVRNARYVSRSIYRDLSYQQGVDFTRGCRARCVMTASCASRRRTSIGSGRSRITLRCGATRMRRCATVSC